MARRKGRMSWYPWYPEDFYGDENVRVMTPLARGAYRELLDHSWATGPLQDPERILRGLGWDPELWDSEIRVCWEPSPQGFKQPRLELERVAASEQSERARRANAIRWGEDPNGSRGDIPTESTPPPPPPPKKAPPTPRAKPAAEPVEGFIRREEFSAICTPATVEAWREWCEYRRASKRRVTPTAATKQLREATAWGAAGLVQAIETSIKKDWQGLFEPKGEPVKKPQAQGRVIEDRRLEPWEIEARERLRKEYEERERPARTAPPSMPRGLGSVVNSVLKKTGNKPQEEDRDDVR